MIKTIPVCRASLEDINKALRKKPSVMIEEARSRLPDQTKEFAHLFTDGINANKLPPNRGLLDHDINLRHEDGKPLTPTWGPLCPK